MSLRNSSPQYKIVSFLRNKIPSHGTRGTSHMHMYTQTHTFPDKRPDDPMASTQKKGKSFDLPQLELNYLLVFLSVSMPPTDRHTALLGYIQCHYIQILPEHSSPRCELFSSPVLRRSSWARTGLSVNLEDPQNTRLGASRHSSSGPYISFNA